MCCLRAARVLLCTTWLVISACTIEVSAEPQQLDCVLTDTEAHPASERRPVVVVFDKDAKTLTAKDGDHSYTFSKVSISNVAISGLDDNVSIGIDRSSLGIVWQQYETDKVATEYGRCRPHS